MSGTRISNLLGKITIVLIICCCGMVAQGKYGGGTGEPNDPYQIWDANHMQAIGADANDWDKCFRLMADVDLGSYTGTSFNIIGNGGNPFTGVFDGNDHVISRFTYNHPILTRKGLFGCLGGVTSSVKNLRLSDPNVIANGIVGALCGELREGNITMCYVEGGSVRGKSVVGGLVGNNDNGGIANCSSTCTVIGSQCCIGGLVGKNWNGHIYNCFSSGSVSGDYAVGGLVGTGSSEIGSSFSESSVAGNSGIGGLVGSLNGYVFDCYSIGTVTGAIYVGGLIGASYGGVTNSFWDVNSSGIGVSDGGIGLTTAQMQDPNTFKGIGWDYVGEYENGASDNWATPNGGGYPILWWQLSSLPSLPVFSGGSGTTSDPYLIGSVDDLSRIELNTRLAKAHFKLVADIDLNDVNFPVIGNKAIRFSGVFDGDGHKISNFTHETIGINYIGLFRYVSGSKAEIRNVRLVAPNVNAEQSQLIGGLSGYVVNASITNCSIEGGKVSGTEYHGGGVIGSRYMGGLIGTNVAASISKCWTNTAVSGYDYIGGLVGVSQGGIISDSHAGGNVKGTDTGGLVGANSSVITKCYATGNVDGGDIVGGLIGANGGDGIVLESYAEGNVDGGSMVGGLVGWAEGGNEIVGCRASGAVSGNSSVGGLAGQNSGSILRSYSEGSVLGSLSDVGGLVGNNWGSIAECYSTSPTQGGREVGGLVGRNSSPSPLRDCFATGSVSGHEKVGGFVGMSIGGNPPNVIERCYSVGTVTGEGGFAGITFQTIVSNSFWDVNTSQKSSSSGGTGKTTYEMQTKSTFADAGWDFMNVWSICEQRNYPRLLWQIPTSDFLCPDGVDFFDYSFFAGHWAEDNCGASNDCDGTDLDLLGTVDINDLRLFVDNWLRGF